MDQPVNVANPACGQLNKENELFSAPFAPKNSILRHKFRRPVPRQPADSLFDYVFYLVIVGLSNIIAVVLGNYPGMLELLESLLCCLVRHHSSFFCFLSRCNINVLFNHRGSSFTESDLCKEYPYLD